MMNHCGSRVEVESAREVKRWIATSAQFRGLRRDGLGVNPPGVFPLIKSSVGKLSQDSSSLHVITYVADLKLPEIPR